MEGGQKVKIDLESGIDVKSSDMLVPVDNPLFMHNRQKYQGHCLPSSLRFELDGWAAGDSVYNFEVADPTFKGTNGYTLRRTRTDNGFMATISDANGKEVASFFINNTCRILNNYNCNNVNVSSAFGVTSAFVSLTFNGVPMSILRQSYITSTTIGNTQNTDRITDPNLLSRFTLQTTYDVQGRTVYKILDKKTSTSVKFAFISPDTMFNVGATGDNNYEIADFSHSSDNKAVFSKGELTFTIQKSGKPEITTGATAVDPSNITAVSQNFDTHPAEYSCTFEYTIDYKIPVQLNVNMKQQIIGAEKIISNKELDTFVNISGTEEQSTTALNNKYIPFEAQAVVHNHKLDGTNDEVILSGKVPVWCEATITKPKLPGFKDIKGVPDKKDNFVPQMVDLGDYSLAVSNSSLYYFPSPNIGARKGRITWSNNAKIHAYIASVDPILLLQKATDAVSNMPVSGETVDYNEGTWARWGKKLCLNTLEHTRINDRVFQSYPDHINKAIKDINNAFPIIAMSTDVLQSTATKEYTTDVNACRRRDDSLRVYNYTADKHDRDLYGYIYNAVSRCMTDGVISATEGNIQSISMSAYDDLGYQKMSSALLAHSVITSKPLDNTKQYVAITDYNDAKIRKSAQDYVQPCSYKTSTGLAGSVQYSTKIIDNSTNIDVKQLLDSTVIFNMRTAFIVFQGLRPQSIGASPNTLPAGDYSIDKPHSNGGFIHVPIEFITQTIQKLNNVVNDCVTCIFSKYTDGEHELITDGKNIYSESEYIKVVSNFTNSLLSNIVYKLEYNNPSTTSLVLGTYTEKGSDTEYNIYNSLFRCTYNNQYNRYEVNIGSNDAAYVAGQYNTLPIISFINRATLNAYYTGIAGLDTSTDLHNAVDKISHELGEFNSFTQAYRHTLVKHTDISAYVKYEYDSTSPLALIGFKGNDSRQNGLWTEHVYKCRLGGWDEFYPASNLSITAITQNAVALPLSKYDDSVKYNYTPAYDLTPVNIMQFTKNESDKLKISFNFFVYLAAKGKMNPDMPDGYKDFGVTLAAYLPAAASANIIDGEYYNVSHTTTVHANSTTRKMIATFTEEPLASVPITGTRRTSIWQNSANTANWVNSLVNCFEFVYYNNCTNAKLFDARFIIAAKQTNTKLYFVTKDAEYYSITDNLGSVPIPINTAVESFFADMSNANYKGWINMSGDMVRAFYLADGNTAITAAGILNNIVVNHSFFENIAPEYVNGVTATVNTRWIKGVATQSITFQLPGTTTVVNATFNNTGTNARRLTISAATYNVADSNNGNPYTFTVAADTFDLPDPEDVSSDAKLPMLNITASGIKYFCKCKLPLLYVGDWGSSVSPQAAYYINSGVIPELKDSILSYVDDNGVNVITNINSGNVTYLDDIFKGIFTSGDNYYLPAFVANFEYAQYCTISAILQGMYYIFCKDIGNYMHVDVLTNDVQVQLYNSNIDKLTNFLVGINDFFNANVNKLTYKYVNVNDSYANNHKYNIATVDTDKEYQFLKQMWNTNDDTENYWFINELGDVLELTNKGEGDTPDTVGFRFWRKTGDIDDWNGDVYAVSGNVIPRSNIITADVLKYGMTNYNAIDNSVGVLPAGPNGYTPCATFWTLSKPDNSTLRITLYYISYDNNSISFMQPVHYDIPVRYRNIGETLNPSGSETMFNTYSDIDATALVFDSKISVTQIRQYILFGIHLDNNFNQWTVKIEYGAAAPVVTQGYGFVGLDGSITGGETPVEYFTANKGFNTTVWPIEELKKLHGKGEDNCVNSLNELYTLGSMVVGTDNQQWYIDSNVSGIVSHCTFDMTTGDFVPVTLPINNNYSIIYASSSFYTRTLTDTFIKRKSFQDIIPGYNDDYDGQYDNIISTVRTLFNGFMWLAGNPSIYMLTPKLSLSGYLQQTIGQYAYVHYNSNSIAMERELTKEDRTYENGNKDVDEKMTEQTDIGYISLVSQDELAFNQQVIKQETKPADYTFPYMIILLASLSISAVQLAAEKIQVNTRQNQSATNDKGRSFSQIFLQNMDNLSSSNMSISGMAPTLTSAVSGVMTLDMFYSTSDKQKIAAGPGFVRHNFVAQCVAQSATSNQLEINQIGMQYILKHLSLWETKLSLLIQGYIKLGLEKLASIVGNTYIGIMPGAQTNAAGVAGGTILQLLADGYGAYLSALETFVSLAEQMLDSMGGSQMQSNVTCNKSVHQYDIEGKHKYGAKSESFMWPCWNCGTAKYYTDEAVEAHISDKKWSIHQQKWADKNIDTADIKVIDDITVPFVTEKNSKNARLYWQDDNVHYHTANCVSHKLTSLLPSDMAYVIGAESFLSETPFKNENIDCGNPVFPVNGVQDYIMSSFWKLSRTVAGDATAWVSCKDTKLIDGEPSNVVLSPIFCGVASPYAAIEIKRGVQNKYIRPWAITPDVLALNSTGKNALYKNKMYHAFDGTGYRLISWLGSSGMNKQRYTKWYCFQVNDKFKRSNKLPPNTFLGNFDASPATAVEVDYEDKLYNSVEIPTHGTLASSVVGENPNIIRYALPVFTEFVSTLPAAVKSLATYKLAVVEGVTGLVTELRNAQSAYKAPESVDFTINKTVYRMTREYICQVNTEMGVVTLQELVPALGLTYLGSTPFEAFFYSQATRQYYTFTGGTALEKVDMMERFRNINSGRYNFIDQDVVMQCLATFDRLDNFVHDDTDETDNIMCLLLKDRAVSGEITPPATTIFNSRSWFRVLSLPTGVCYQGPNRCVINRFVFSDYMQKDITANKGKWTRVPREEYHPFRQYADQYNDVMHQIGATVKVNGWTHNPFLLVTSPLGVDSEVDCMFEWEITFAWPYEMELLYSDNDYACVNVLAETFTPGGKLVGRPTHIYLKKDLFTRTGNYGYYSFRYQSKNGAGNRERLHIWSDAYIAVSALQCEYKPITAKRNEILVIQEDIKDMKEF